MLADVAQNILERSQEIGTAAGKAARAPETKAAAESTARVRQQLRERSRREQKGLTGQPAQGDVTVNSRMRAVRLSRNTPGGQEVARGEGEAAEAGTQTSVEGTAMGQRAGRSRGGGSDGEHPQSSPAGESDTQPVMGEQTVRLEAQLEKMRVERDDDPQRLETEEEFYAATQRQASEVGYESITTQWRAQREAALPPSRTPLSYREAVKRYFLTQHAKDE